MLFLINSLTVDNCYVLYGVLKDCTEVKKPVNVIVKQLTFNTCININIVVYLMIAPNFYENGFLSTAV